MIVDPRALHREGDSLPLDPFAFWPDLASRIEGLGGGDEGDAPDYAFHTLYLACGAASVTFTVQAEELTAERGTLILRIHELPDFVGADARQVAISQTQMTDMNRRGGSASLSTDTQEGHTYAILGHIHGDTHVRARALHVTATRRTPDPDDPTRVSPFVAAPDRVGVARQLVSMHNPVLAAPVSQPATSAQLRERVFTQWDAHLPEGTPAERWERVFVARALERYDVLRAGARGLGVGGLGDPLADVLASAGCRLVLTVPAPDDRATLPPGATARVVDPHTIGELAGGELGGGGLAGFDFCYVTAGAGLGNADRQDTLQFVEELLRTLKPGGLAVAILPFDAARRGVLDPQDGPILRRHDLERIGLVLLSRGHQVAQLCFGGDPLVTQRWSEGEGVTPSLFALVVRRSG